MSRLDTGAYVVFVVLSSCLVLASTQWFEANIAGPAGATLFPEFRGGTGSQRVDYYRACVEGCVVLSLAALVLGATHRAICLYTWLKTPVFAGVLAFYVFLICLPPLFVGIAISEVRELRELPMVVYWGPLLAMVSPLSVLGHLLGEMGRYFPRDASTLPFYVAHVPALLLLSWFLIRRERKLKTEYLWTVRQEERP